MNEARAIFNKLGTTFDALDAIEGIAKQVLGNKAEDAFEALHIIAVIVDALKSGFKGKLTVEEVQAEIRSLHKTLVTNDAEADTALEKKFDKG